MDADPMALDYVARHPSTAAFTWYTMTCYFLREWARLCANAADDRGITMDTPLKTGNGHFLVWDQATRYSVNLAAHPLSPQPTAAISAARDLFQRARQCANYIVHH
jgi:hypothetical protein